MNEILTERLQEHINPFFHLGWDFEYVPNIDDFDCDPVLFVFGGERPDGGKTSYDFGRIAFFIDQIKHGLSVPPIDIDNQCSGRNIYPIAIIVDGCHRFAAHILLKKEKMKITYGGRVDLLEYLTGEKDECPER